jgi:GT2 family glycosyltransferase
MIPVLGVPILNRADLAARMVRSIDHPVRELVVVVNGPEDDIVPVMQDAITMNPNVLSVLWCRPGFNLGCGGSWNFVIRSRPAGPWWLIVNADIVFAPGDLAMLVDDMADHGGFATLFEYGAFALDTEVVDRVGWFDEHFVPMYFEDRDYERRLHLAGIVERHLPSKTLHDTSSTIHSDARLALRNGQTFVDNGDYFVLKWGNHPRSGDLYEQPFNGGPCPVSLRQRLVRQAW